MYGDGAFETLRAYGGSVFRWEAHADRLRQSCDALEIDHGLDSAALRERIDETLAANELQEAYVKLSITRGRQPGKLDPAPDSDPTVVVYVSPLAKGGTGSESVWDGPARLQTVSTQRIPDEALPAQAKTHNYLNEILARLELRETDADEALMLDLDGNIAEGATCNIFFVDDDGLRTPRLDGSILPGITRETVLAIAEEEGIPVEQSQYEPARLREADEVFLTNSTWEVRPVASVDGKTIGSGGPGPMTRLLSHLFDQRIDERHYRDSD
jgi:branched chain amino acid aminotransferase apoenzyme (EC 2.6.1.42)